jgi:hypothetical protein
MSKKNKKGKVFAAGITPEKEFDNFVQWLLGNKTWKEAFGQDMPKPTKTI